MNENGTTFLGGDNGLWIFGLLVLLGLMGGNGIFGGGNGRVGEAYSTQADIQRAVDFDTLKSGQAGVVSTIKDASYNNLGEIRGIETAVSNGFSNMQNKFCDIERTILENRYLTEKNITAAGEKTNAMVQKVLDKLAESEINALRGRVNQLELQSAVGNVVRYPTSMSYNAGASPFCPQPCGCGCANI